MSVTPPHILIAEDEFLIAQALSASLEGRGFRVTTASNGKKALEADASDPADILVTDLRMPVMDGTELVRRIRQSRPALPVLVMTANADAVDPEDAERLVIIQKPFPLDALVKILQAVLEDRATQGTEQPTSSLLAED